MSKYLVIVTVYQRFGDRTKNSYKINATTPKAAAAKALKKEKWIDTLSGINSFDQENDNTWTQDEIEVEVHKI